MVEKIVQKYVNSEGIDMGEITYNIHNDEYIYCEMITVFPEHRRKGVATKIIDAVRDWYNLPFRYSVVSEDCTGAKFWNEYTKDKNVERLFGNTFEIKEDAE